jgi:hypothetical protein
MLPLISFETGRKTQTQSSGQPEELRQQMEVWFYSRIGTRPRGQHNALKNLKSLHPRSSRARRESFCPLDKDLSWKSRNRRSNHLYDLRVNQACESGLIARQGPIPDPDRGRVVGEDAPRLVET